jgi:putative protease
MTPRLELLAPAGNWEKLEIALHFGADAVYLAGKNFSLRNFSGNFTLEELDAAVRRIHQLGKKVYVACNIYSANDEQEALAEYLHQLAEIRPDALIVADPAVFVQARRIVPEIPIHISTQANITNYNAGLFWKEMGATRINVARELSLSEIKGISEKCFLEIEAFVHGAMCIAYSGRCLLSSIMAYRHSNRGMCCQPCRFEYAVMEAKRPGQYFPLMEDNRGAYVFNSRDLCMVDHVGQMAEAGIGSLKIEGRMKSVHYVATTVKIYREAIDAYLEKPEDWKPRDHWRTELSKISHRGYCTGFYFGDPDQTLPNYEECLYPGNSVFVGKVLEKSGDRRFKIDMRNRLFSGDKVEILRAKGPVQNVSILSMTDESGFPIAVAQPNSRICLCLDTDCEPLDLIRKTL